MKQLLLSIGLVSLFVAQGIASDPPKPSSEATITSDELELHDNGAKTVFRGHVVLTQEPYILTANRMERVRDTEVVNAFGNIKGTWISEKGEKMVATGERGRYNPKEETIELWDRPKLTRWETAKDTAPVVVTADYFIAYKNEKMLLAKKDVHMTQDRMSAKSHFAKYDQNEQMLHLWGPGQVEIHVEDNKSQGDFLSDRARLSLSPKGARLMDRVTGHVIPVKNESPS